jgi:hypothetical protein
MISNFGEVSIFVPGPVYYRIMQHNLSGDGIRVIRVLKGLDMEGSKNAEAALIDSTR